jgi:hypothetical protein
LQTSTAFADAVTTNDAASAVNKATTYFIGGPLRR